MAREYINREDMLNVGREKLNRSIDKSYDAEDTSKQALKDANTLGNEAKQIATEKGNESITIAKENEKVANEANIIAKDTNDRMNHIISGETDSAEIIDSRKPFDATNPYETLGIRLDTEKKETYENIKIVEEKIEKNKWLTDLNGSYIAHKGLTGIKFDGPIKEGVYPDNTVKSFEYAGELGFKAIETDIIRCKDGFIISHEEDTTLLSGTLKQFKDMTVSEIKERNITKQYIGGGTYNTLQGSNINYKVPTLKETLDICKKYNMYIILDVRFMTGYTYTQKDIDDIVSIVRECGMEKFCIWYGNSNYKICDILSDSILAVASINENNVEESIRYIKKYKNYTFSVGESSYLKFAVWSKEFNIPLMVWTIDEYFKADDIFFNGANCILTNRLIKKANVKHLNMTSVDVLTSFRQNGQGSYLLEDETHKFDTSTYLSQYYYVPKNTLNKGDIVKLKATGRTLRSGGTNAFGRIIIDNSLTGNKYIRSLSFFKTENFEEREVYFIVSDTEEDISINFGMAGGTFSGDGSCEIKDVSLEVLSNVNFFENAFGLIYCYNGTISLRPGFVSNGIKSVKKSVTDASIIEIEYDLKRLHKLKPVVMSSLDAYSNQYMYKIIPQNVDITLGVLKVKFLDADNKIVPDVDKLQLAFSIQIM